jgi:hypothetical protein
VPFSREAKLMAPKLSCELSEVFVSLLTCAQFSTVGSRRNAARMQKIDLKRKSTQLDGGFSPIIRMYVMMLP